MVWLGSLIYKIYSGHDIAEILLKLVKHKSINQYKLRWQLQQDVFQHGTLKNVLKPSSQKLLIVLSKNCM